MIKKDFLFIIAGNDYIQRGYINEGYDVETPYKDRTLVGRIAREICFRLKCLPKKIWFNKQICHYNPKYIIVRDPLITTSFLEWLKDIFPQARIFYKYANLVGNANHLKPNEIPEGVSIITYDENDSKKYGIKYVKSGSYFSSYVKEKENIKYDVLFVGRDKGRGKYLLDLKEQFEKLGLKVKFVITSDGRFTIRKKYHSKPIAYDEITYLLAESRAVLNVTLPSQKGITMRDFESVFNDIKLITTNKDIVHTDIYNINNVFVLDNDNIKDVINFLNKPIERRDDLKQAFSIENMLAHIINF